MRRWIFFASLIIASCSQPDAQLVIVRVREPKRVDQCNVFLDSVRDDNEKGKTIRRAFLQTICGVPESSLQGQWWWGDGPQPPGFSLDPGDCMPLNDVYYCLENVDHANAATFRRMYFKPEHPRGKLRRIQ